MPSAISSPLLSSTLLLLSADEQLSHSSLRLNLKTQHNVLISSKSLRHPLHFCRCSSNPIEEELEESESEIEVEAEVEKVDGKKNRRVIKAQIPIEADLETIWGVLTNYEGLSDFIPSLAVSQLLDYKDNVARLYQVGQQELALGFKFSAKGVIECYEKEMEILSPSNCRKRAIDFKMVEGDFKIFEGQWSIEQVYDDFEKDDGFETTLSYMVELEPKLMVPIRLIEGRLCKEVKTNLVSIRDEAQRLQKLQNENNNTFSTDL